jgi:hypothetical protein
MTAPGGTAGPPDRDAPPRLDITVAHQSRVYNYLLGGKDNFAIDREAADRALEAFPGLAAWARNNRAFLARAVSYLVSEAGVRQFLDLGTGLPSADNTHEVAQRIAPSTRICYVDNDPVVLTHARALLSSDPAGMTGYIDADVRDSDRVLGEAAQILDLTQPTAVMLLAILHVIPDEDDPWQIVARYMDALPAGSFLVISHPARDIHASQVSELTKRFDERLGGVKSRARTHDEVAGFFTGLDLVPPGVVVTPQWRPDPDGPAPDADPAYAAVARKP